MKIDSYWNYFEHLAINDPHICHIPTPCNYGFFKADPNELLKGFRSKIKEKGVFMSLLNYNWGVDKESQTKNYEGGFVIAGWHGDDPQKLCEIMVLTECIIEKIIERICYDSSCGHPLWCYSLDDPGSFQVYPQICIGDLNYSGWLVQFEFINDLEICSVPDPDYWKDDPTEKNWQDQEE